MVSSLIWTSPSAFIFIVAVKYDMTALKFGAVAGMKRRKSLALASVNEPRHDEQTEGRQQDAQQSCLYRTTALNEKNLPPLLEANSSIMVCIHLDEERL